jgi:rubredoxin
MELVHLLKNARRTLCGLLKDQVGQFCPTGMWDAIKPERKCPECDALYKALQNG